MIDSIVHRRLAALALSMALLSSAFGQTPGTGAIKGSVLDPAGLPVANAHVLLVNESTKTSRAVDTTSEGLFTASLLSPGDYSIKVERPGLEGEPEDIPLQERDVRDSCLTRSPLRFGNRHSRDVDRSEARLRASPGKRDRLCAHTATHLQHRAPSRIRGAGVQQLDERSCLIGQPLSLPQLVAVDVEVAHDQISCTSDSPSRQATASHRPLDLAVNKQLMHGGVESAKTASANEHPIAVYR